MATLHDSTFGYLKPTDGQLVKMNELREITKKYVEDVDRILPAGLDKTYILRRIRETAMWNNVALTRNADGSPREQAKMIHAMIDIETLSLSKRPVITECAITFFDENNIIESLEGYFQLDPQIKEGRKIDEDTLRFWLSDGVTLEHQSKQCKMFNFFCNGITPFLETNKPERFWCNGLSFDIPIIEQVCMDYYLPIPWKYNATRDTRTLWEIVGLDVKKEERYENEKAHTALGDALFQARMVQKAWKMLGRKEDQ